MKHSKKPILVTGAAGFIGFHVVKALLEKGEHVVGFDNLNDYYDPALKQARLGVLLPHPHFSFLKLDLSERQNIEELFQKYHFDFVIHLAAQAGVQYSLTHPHTYGESNLTGFLNLIEACRQNSVKHFLFASSSSVYGGNSKVPFSVQDSVDHPVSLYAATKRAGELMAYAYAHLYQLPCTGLRFFTVYGPWGRPDMAYFKFTRAILEGKPIELFDPKKTGRDFTYIDDIVEGVIGALSHAQPPKQGSAPFQIFNLGNDQPVILETMVTLLEKLLGKEALKKMAPLPPGDVPLTHADISESKACFGFEPKTSLEDGLKKFVKWYFDFYG